MGAWIEQHSLEREALLGLLVGALRNVYAGGMESLGKLIADELELSQIEHPGLGGVAGRLLQSPHRKGGHEGVRQIAL